MMFSYVYAYIHMHIHIHTQMAPDLQWFDLRFFTFMMLKKQYAVSRKHTSSFDFDLFPG